LDPEQIDRLWKIFVEIARTWGDPKTDPMPQRSQWLEFVQLRTGREPSYLEEYHNALRVLDDLKAQHGRNAVTKLVRDPGIKSDDPATTPLAHAKKYVVEEFIRVWLATGGFRAYGAGNYNGYISGSRFGVRPSYRQYQAPVEVSASPPAGTPADTGTNGGNPAPKLPRSDRRILRHGRIPDGPDRRRRGGRGHCQGVAG
jgi:hypothetical protein